MYNYLKAADGHGAIVDGTETSYGYWTMNARSDNTSRAWFGDYDGDVSDYIVGYPDCGARAVVEINK